MRNEIVRENWVVGWVIENKGFFLGEKFWLVVGCFWVIVGLLLVGLRLGDVVFFVGGDFFLLWVGVVLDLGCSFEVVRIVWLGGSIYFLVLFCCFYGDGDFSIGVGVGGIRGRVYVGCYVMVR